MHHRRRGPHAIASLFRIASLALAPALVCGLLVGCSSKPKPEARTVMPTVRDVPAPLRGTVGAQATFAGIDPVLVTGYGFVVGLDGTGGEPLTEPVAAHMERLMALQGVGRGYQGSEPGLTHPDGRGVAPAELLRDPNTAVVVVYANVPPGAPEGMTFDVFVQSLNATSLEGGRLWTSDLQIGRSQPFGGRRSRVIAQARGPILVNPFADPAAGGSAMPTQRDAGRILGGGTVTEPLEIAINLDNPSHARARAIALAINSRFPPGPGDRGDAARGMNDSTVALDIPAAWRDRPGDFVKMVQHLPIDVRIPAEAYAERYVRALPEHTDLAQELTWALRALGRDALPEVRELYDSSDRLMRMVGLRVGAFLGDSQAAAPLIELAAEGPTNDRVEVIELLGRLDTRVARADGALRDLLDDEELLVRVAAYEALASRAEREQLARLRMQRAELASAGRDMSAAEMEFLARLQFSGMGRQGIERRLVDGKFLLDVVPSDEPMVYMTLQGEPRLAIFAPEEALLEPPLLVSAWDDRLLMTAEGGDSPIRLMYRDYKSGRVTVREVEPSLVELVRFMAHTPTPERPEPGLGMSYGEVVGALHAISEDGATSAEFITEQDRLLAELIEAQRGRVVEDRPERPGEEGESYRLPVPEIEGAEEAGEPGEQPGEGERPRQRERFRPRIVPLDPAAGMGEATDGEGGPE